MGDNHRLVLFLIGKVSVYLWFTWRVALAAAMGAASESMDLQLWARWCVKREAGDLEAIQKSDTVKQIVQYLKTGELSLADVPSPRAGGGVLVVAADRSLISAGTERMLVEFSQANVIQKARSQPDKVRQVLDKIQTDGLVPTLEAVFRKLDEPVPLGYCNAGRVVEVGPGVSGFAVGDRVASNGPHAEIVCVPKHLCARIPDNVADDSAAFTVLGAIGLQGIRLIHPTLGERVVVQGAGLIGLLAIQLLRASGCDVLAVDVNPGRLEMAARFGASTCNASGGDPVAAAELWTRGQGVDAVLITASAQSDELVHQAAVMCRKRGRIVLVGVVGLSLRRDDFYKKELTFQVSCSYGPGRYDEDYEQRGRDYPLPYVRWTEQRNFEAVLQAMSVGTLDVAPLITHRFALDDAVKAYETIQKDPGALGVLLEYPGTASTCDTIELRPAAATAARPTGNAGAGRAVLGVIGAGGFAKGVLLPALAKTGAELRCIADLNGVAGRHAGVKFKADRVTTDHRRVLDDPEIRAVFVVVGHHLHARLVIEALEAGKHVFVEKPLAMTRQELESIRRTLDTARDRDGAPLTVTVGFNRRFSPHTVRLKELLLGRSEPLCLAMTINAGMIPSDHWTQDPERGGGRIIGEACHFIDLLVHLTGSPVRHVAAVRVGEGPAVRDDKMSIQLGFADGSVGAISYFANGSKSYPKETLEVFSDGRVVRLDNFRVVTGYGVKGFKRYRTWRQDKGHAAELAEYVRRLEQGTLPLIPYDELENVTEASFATVESAATHQYIKLQKT